MSGLVIGIKGARRVAVETGVNTASALHSGGLEVFATPAMIALMEGAAAESVLPYMEEGCSTVGTHIDVRHISATPVGMSVRCETELVEIDRRRLTFTCRAWDDAGLIGEGTQERFIVNDARFTAKAAEKLEG